MEGSEVAKVLVVDDSHTAFASIRQALAGAEHEVRHLDNFLDLTREIRDDPPDLILLDLEMPMLPGEQAGEYIRKYETKPLKIVVHSSLEVERLKEVSRKLDAVGFIQKGAAGDELRTRIEGFLRLPARR